jgi:hypothetical protein
MSEPTRSWKDVFSEEPVNAVRARLYEQLMEAQERIAQLLYRTGVRDEVVEAALDHAEEALTEDERREDLYLSALAHYVTALGGRVEVRAVFGDEAVVVRSEPRRDAR